jgi:predicted TIM-barrel fold metal-dependent hydrolase
MKPSEYGRPIPYLDDVAREFPQLRIVGGHIGYPWTNEMIALATKHSNVYIDTSAYTAKRFPQELVTYMRTNGKKKVLFHLLYDRPNQYK